jgi:CelD/BcsL family acetyltransferase involved in cellulose biosynthesis
MTDGSRTSSKGEVVHIEVIEDAERFDALGDVWRSLERRCPGASIFVTWDWQRLWWQHYGATHSLKVVIARVADEVVGILPLYIRRHHYLGLVPLRKLRFVGTGGDTSPDYLDPLIDPALSGPVSTRLAHYVVHGLKGWDVLQLTELGPEAAFTVALLENCRQRGCAVRVGEPARITRGELPGTWDAYLTGLSASRRQAVRQNRRKFEKLEQAKFRLCSDADELCALFNRLAELHRLRWHERAAQHSFSSDAYLAFHAALVDATYSRDRLRFYVLEAAGSVIAILYCFKFNDTLFYFQSGFDPAFSDVSPGQALIGYAIESAIEENCHAFDMLKGDYDHKRHFFKDSRLTVQVRAYRYGVVALLYRMKMSAGVAAVRRWFSWPLGYGPFLDFPCGQLASTAVGFY